MSGWEAFIDEHGQRQVMPLYDLREHEERDCWCGPTLDGLVLVHHSMDRREEYERGRLAS